MFFVSSNFATRSSSKSRSPPKMDPSSDPPPLQPILSNVLRRPPRPKPVPVNAIPAAQSNGSSNAPRVFFVVRRSTQNVSGISLPSPLIPQFPCFPKPPFEPPEGATHPAASPATSSPAIVAQDDPRLPDPLCSKQKYL